MNFGNNNSLFLPLILRGSWRGIPKFLILILGLALLLHLIGITYGLPHFFVGDEQSQLGAALVMLKNFNFVPGTAAQDFKLLYYPPVMSYFYLLILVPFLGVWSLFKGFNPAELATAVALDPSVPWLAGRLLIAILAVLSVYLVYLLGSRIFGKSVGLAASLFLATSFLHVSLSHFTRHWVPSIFFEILVMIAAYNIWQYGRRKDYFWAAIFAAMSFGVGFIGIVAAFFPVVAHFGRNRTNKTNRTNWTNLGVFLAILVVLVAGIVLLYPQRFLEIFQGTDVSVAEQKSILGFLASLGFHFRTLLLADPVIFILSMIGVIWGIWVRRGITLTFVVYALVYLSSLYFVIHNEPRYISFLYPGFAIFAALPASMLLGKFGRVRVAAILLIVFLGYPLAVAGRFSWLLTRDDTRVLAKQWVEGNLSSETKVLSFLNPEVLTPSKEAIKLKAKLDPTSLRNRDRVLLNLPPEKYPKSFELLNTPEPPLEFIPQYALVQYWNLQEYLKIPAKYKSDPQMIRFSPGNEAGPVDFTGNFDAPTFLLFKMQRLGPIVEIHKL